MPVATPEGRDKLRESRIGYSIDFRKVSNSFLGHGFINISYEKT
jgi:hypothetical protein